MSLEAGRTTGQVRNMQQRESSERLNLRVATTQELGCVHGGSKFWDRVKAVGRWIKNHVTRGPGDPGKGIGIKGTHDIGGGGKP